MHLHLPNLSLALPFLLGVCVSCGSAPAPKQPDMNELMQLMAEKAAVGKEHKSLAYLVGEWDVALRAKFGPDAPWTESTGTATYKTILGGRFLFQETSATMGGMPFQGIQILGFNRLTGKYSATWMDSMSTWSVESVGEERDGLIEFKGTMIDVETPEGRPFRSTMRKVSDDKMVGEMFDTHDGVEHLVMTMTSTRRK